MNTKQLSSQLSKLETDLDKQGDTVQKLLTYLADVNEDEAQRFQSAEDLEMLMIFGGDDLVGLRKIFTRYFEQLRPKGINTILITGGIGRLTATLLDTVAKGQKSGEVSSLSIQTQADETNVTFTQSQELLGREKTKLVKHPPFDLHASKESLLPYVAEADIYLELFLQESLRHGYSPDDVEIFGYDEYLRDSGGMFVIDRHKTETARHDKILKQDSSVYVISPEQTARLVNARRGGKIVLFVEGVSTNTGNNTRYSLEMLLSMGYIQDYEEAKYLARRTVVYQQPALQLRTKYTVDHQFGALPISVSYIPDYKSLSLLDRATLLLLVAGEYRRLASYSRPPHNFFRRPDNWDEGIVEFFQKHAESLTMIDSFCHILAGNAKHL